MNLAKIKLPLHVEPAQFMETDNDLKRLWHWPWTKMICTAAPMQVSLESATTAGLLPCAPHGCGAGEPVPY